MLISRVVPILVPMLSICASTFTQANALDAFADTWEKSASGVSKRRRAGRSPQAYKLATASTTGAVTFGEESDAPRCRCPAEKSPPADNAPPYCAGVARTITGPTEIDKDKELSQLNTALAQ